MIDLRSPEIFLPNLRYLPPQKFPEFALGRSSVLKICCSVCDLPHREKNVVYDKNFKNLVHHLRSQGPGFTFRNRFSGYLSTAIKESYCGYVSPRGQQLPVARLLFAILLRNSIISPCRVANSGFAATTVS